MWCYSWCWLLTASLCKCLSRVADGNLLMILSSLQVSGEDCILGTPLTGETGKLLLVIGRSNLLFIDRVTFKLLEAPPLPMEGKVHCIHCPGPGGVQIPITLQCFALFLPTLHVQCGVIKTRWKDKWLSGLHSAPASRLSPRLQTPRYKGFGMRLY